MKKLFGIVLLCLVIVLCSCAGDGEVKDTTPPDVTTEELAEGVVGLNGKALERYVIVVNNSAYTEEALRFSSNLKTATGVSLEVVEVSEVEEGDLVINYGTLSTENAWEYRIEVDGADVNLYGTGLSGAYYAAEKFLTLAKGAEKITVESANYSVKEMLMENKTYAMQRLFDENGKLIDGKIAEPVTVYASLNEIPAEVAATDPIVVVFLGASNSEGGPTYFKMFADALASLLHKNVVYYNAGVGGTGSNLSAARFYHSAGQYAPDIIILDDNSNDTGNCTNHESYITYTESIMYQAQQLEKIPVFIFNWIPRAGEPDSELLKKTNSMLASKSSVTEYYGVSHISSYDALRREWEKESADILAKGTASEYFMKHFRNLKSADLTAHKEFADFYDNLTWRNELPFTAYLAIYFNLQNIKDGLVEYNVHPKESGRVFIGGAMVEALLSDPYRYLTNKIMPEDFALSTKNKYAKNSTVEYTMIGSDGTVLSAKAETGEKREITYVGEWNIYTAENPFNAVKNDVNGGNSDKIAYEKITMSSGLIYKTPYFGNGIAQAYNAQGASFSFKTTADEISFYIPISGVGLSSTITVTDPDGKKVNISNSTLTCYEASKQSYGRIKSWISLPKDDKEYTVTVTIDAPDLEGGKYIFRLGYIIEKNYTR